MLYRYRTLSLAIVAVIAVLSMFSFTTLSQVPDGKLPGLSLLAPTTPPVEKPPTMSDVPRTMNPLTSPFSSNVPVFDGVLSPGEWSDAQYYPIGYYGGNSNVRLWIKNDCKTLYMACQGIYLTTPNSYYYQNVFNFYFDTFNGGDYTYCSYGTGAGQMEKEYTIPAAAWPGLSENAVLHHVYYGGCYYGWWLAQPNDPWFYSGTNGVTFARQTTSVNGTVWEIAIDLNQSHFQMPYITSANTSLRGYINVAWVNQIYGYGYIYGGWTVYGLGTFTYPVYSYNGWALDKLYLTAPPPGMGGSVSITDPVMSDPSGYWAFATNQSLSWTTTVSADPAQTLTGVTEIYGPATETGGLGPLVKSSTSTKAATPSPQTWTATVPLTPPALATGYYDIFIKITFIGICGPTTQTFQYRIFVHQPGEGYCVVYPGDTNNDKVCNLGDKNAVQNYIFKANLNPLWLYGPRRFKVGRITGQTTPLSIFDWVAQPAKMWQDGMGLGCYMDTDGNGAVNSQDLWGVKINVGKTHSFQGQPSESENVLPINFELEQNYPNPFNPNTQISYSLPEQSQVTLKVTDAVGREIATLVNGTVEAGYQSVNFAPVDASSGTYFYSITAKGLKSGNEFTSMKKMLLSK